jgi:hypothetical protein
VGIILIKNRLLLPFICLFIQLASVVQAKTWLVELRVKANGYSYTRYFGVDSLGTDGYDAGLDATCPPPGFTFYSYFQIDSSPYSLSKDIRSSAEDSIIWIFKIVNATGMTDTMSWNPNELTSEGNVILDDTIDMKSCDKAVYTGNQTLTIRYTNSNQGYEQLGGSQSNIFPIVYSCPNPMHSGATIRYQMITDNFVSLKIYDITGTLVTTLVNRLQDAGIHTVCWYGKDSANKNVSSGIYFCRFRLSSIGNKEILTHAKKLILLR